MIINTKREIITPRFAKKKDVRNCYKTLKAKSSLHTTKVRHRSTPVNDKKQILQTTWATNSPRIGGYQTYWARARQKNELFFALGLL
ncbi:MAG: hypothetical protein IKX56_04210 [Muribaculaceae bacterium]|nr:hypothetical protein [Muribaculaceae bacterium]